MDAVLSTTAALLAPQGERVVSKSPWTNDKAGFVAVWNSATGVDVVCETYGFAPGTRDGRQKATKIANALRPWAIDAGTPLKRFAGTGKSPVRNAVEAPVLPADPSQWTVEQWRAAPMAALEAMRTHADKDIRRQAKATMRLRA